MWIQVDPTHAGEKSWVNPAHIERCDANANPEPPWALLTLRSGAVCTVSDANAMKRLAKMMAAEMPRA